MSDEYFVITVGSEGVPVSMYGPYDYDKGIQVLMEALKTGKNCGAVSLSEEEIRAINEDGYFEFENGGGIFLVQPEKFGEKYGCWGEEFCDECDSLVPESAGVTGDWHKEFCSCYEESAHPVQLDGGTIINSSTGRKW